MQARRERTVSDIPGAPCQLCNGATVIAQTQAVRRGAARLNPRWNPEIRVYELCQACGAKRLISEHVG
jgi:hypothetical protein